MAPIDKHLVTADGIQLPARHEALSDAIMTKVRPRQLLGVFVVADEGRECAVYEISYKMPDMDLLIVGYELEDGTPVDKVRDEDGAFVNAISGQIIS